MKKNEIKFNSNLINHTIKDQFDSIKNLYAGNLNFLSAQKSFQDRNIDKLEKELNYLKHNKKNNISFQKDKLLERKKEELENAWKKQKKLKYKQNTLKKLIIGVSTSGSIIAGFSIGLSAYFGLKNVNSKINQKINELKSKILLNENIIKKIKPKDSLFEVLKIILELSFKKDLPAVIIDVIDKTILKTLLNDYVTSESFKELEKIMKKDFETKSSEIVERILNDLSSIQFDDDVDAIIKSVQKKIAEIIKQFIPDFIKQTLLFLIKIDNNEGDTKGKSILGLIIKNILKKYKIIIKDAKNISQLISFYFTKITDGENRLINFIVNVISVVIEKNTITFNILKDFYTIINESIAKLLTKNGKIIDINLIFDTLVPIILNVIDSIVDENNESGLLDFINNLFKEENNETKLIYAFILKKDYLNTDVYLQNFQNQSKNEIILPKFEIGFSTIIPLIFNLAKGINLLKSFLSIFIKPIAALLKTKKEEAKKALFRMVSLYAFIYYKYAPDLGSIGNSILGFFNPFDPETLFKNLIKKYSINNSEITIDEIFGKKGEVGWLFSQTYKILELAENAAKENEKDSNANSQRQELVKKLKKGKWDESSNS
ncbi:hypothetical protein QMA90_02565 [Mycoplasma sp. M6879]|nr:hypothetical protein [Mycoplasma phocimorsus]